MESIVLWGLGFCTAFALLLSKQLHSGILLFGLFGLFVAGAYLFMGAPDVSFTSMALGAALTTFVYLVAIKKAGVLHIYYVPTDSMIFSHPTIGLTGFEYELLRGFAAQQHLELAFHEMDSYQDLAEKPPQTGVFACGMTYERANRSFSKQHLLVSYLPTRIFLLPNGEQTDLVRLKSLLVRNKMKNVEPKPLGEDTYVFVFEPSSVDLGKNFDTYIKQVQNTDEWNALVKRHLG